MSTLKGLWSASVLRTLPNPRASRVAYEGEDRHNPTNALRRGEILAEPLAPLVFRSRSRSNCALRDFSCTRAGNDAATRD